MICFFINIRKIYSSVPARIRIQSDSGNSNDSGRNKLVHSPEFFMTCSVPVFGTDRNIPAVPVFGIDRNIPVVPIETERN